MSLRRKRRKIYILKKILELLEDHSYTPTQLYDTVKEEAERDYYTMISKRNFWNYPKELRELGLIVRHNGKYSLSRYRKQDFANENDRVRFMEHCKVIVDWIRLIQPEMVLNELAFEPDESYNPATSPLLTEIPRPRTGLPECRMLREHLRTGYYSVYLLLQKYKKTVQRVFKDKNEDYELYIFRQFIPRFVMDELTTTTNEEAQEIRKLKKQLMGELYYLHNDVVNGNPLRGSCKHCRDKKKEE